MFHCPFCHGWEVRDQPLAVLADGDRAVHMASLLRGWSDDVVLLTDGAGGLDATSSRGCPRRASPSTIARSPNSPLRRRVEAVVFADGSRLPRRGLLVTTTLHQRTGLAAQLGVEFVAAGPVSAEAIDVDPL